jgi:hypothetical protein
MSFKQLSHQRLLQPLSLALSFSICLSAISETASKSANTPPIPARTSFQKFKTLLDASPEQRRVYLATRPPASRHRIEQSLAKFDAMPSHILEHRLQEMQLRWSLLSLIKQDQDQRAKQIKLIPAPYTELVSQRLKLWDILPPPLQQDILKYGGSHDLFERFANSSPSERQAMLKPFSQSQRDWIEKQLPDWLAMAEVKRNKIQRSFSSIFELAPDENIKSEVSEKELRLMEATLLKFDKLPEHKRQECIASFEKFANMAPEERGQFLRNAKRWVVMSPKERSAWRELVNKLPERFPPIPKRRPSKNPPPLPNSD